jgi:hypothetical protein
MSSFSGAQTNSTIDRWAYVSVGVGLIAIKFSRFGGNGSSNDYYTLCIAFLCCY